MEEITSSESESPKKSDSRCNQDPDSVKPLMEFERKIWVMSIKDPGLVRPVASIIKLQRCFHAVVQIKGGICGEHP